MPKCNVCGEKALVNARVCASHLHLQGCDKCDDQSCALHCMHVHRDGGGQSRVCGNFLHSARARNRRECALHSGLVCQVCMNRPTQSSLFGCSNHCIAPNCLNQVYANITHKVTQPVCMSIGTYTYEPSRAHNMRLCRVHAARTCAKCRKDDHRWCVRCCTAICLNCRVDLALYGLCEDCVIAKHNPYLNVIAGKTKSILVELKRLPMSAVCQTISMLYNHTGSENNCAQLVMNKLKRRRCALTKKRNLIIRSCDYLDVLIKQDDG